MSEIQVGQINSTDGSTAITTGAGGYVSFAKTQIGGRRNLIINSQMQVAQRGTSATLTSGLVFCVDRFKHTANTGGAGTASQQSFTVGQTDVPNATYYLRHDQTTGASAAPSVRQYIEDVNTYQGETVVLSYYAKVGSGTLTVTPQIQQNFGSGGSSAVSVNSTPTTHTITTSWQKFTCTFSLPSVSGKTIGSGNHLRLFLQFPTSTTFTFDLAQVQLEVGTVATLFEHRSYGEELALCQRYYYRRSNNTGGVVYDLMGFGYVSGSAIFMVHHPVPMRAEPSFDRSATDVFSILDSSGNIADSTSASISSLGSEYGVAMFAGDTNLSTDENCILRINDNDWYEFDAEL